MDNKNSFNVISYDKTTQQNINTIEYNTTDFIINNCIFGILRFHNIDNLPKNTNNIKLNTYYIRYNNQIDNLPTMLLILKINNYNRYINNLPKSLIKLELKYNFNKKINKLPTNLKILMVGEEFNQQLDNLPNNLIKLSFHRYYKIISKKYNSGILYNFDLLPESLRIINIPYGYTKKINDLPASVEIIQIYKHQQRLINTMYHNKIQYID